MLNEKLASLRKIIEVLQPQEKVLVRNYLKAFDKRQKGHKPKGLVLFDLYLKHPDNAKVLALLRTKLGGKGTDDAVRMTLIRLKEKVIQCLMLEVNINREGILPRNQARAEIHRNYLCSIMFNSRGAFHESRELLRRNIELANEYEFCWELSQNSLQYANFKRRHVSELEYKRLVQFSREAREKFNCQAESEIVFNEFLKELSRKSANRKVMDKGYTAFLEKTIDQIAQLYEKSKLVSIQYQLKLVEAEYYQSIRAFDKAHEQLSEILEFTNHPAIYTRFLRPSSLINLIQNEVYQGNFDNVFHLVDKFAEDFIRVPVFNTDLNTYLLHAMFFKGRFAEALDFASDSSKFPDVEVYASIYRKHHYHLAHIHLALGDPRKAKRELALCDGFLNDREGWHIGHRITSIMASIQATDHDLADAQIAALRQFVREGVNQADVSERNLTIIKVLSGLRSRSYDFGRVRSEMLNELNLLREPEGPNSWDVYTPELLCFHIWFDALWKSEPYPGNFDSAFIFSKID